MSTRLGLITFASVGVVALVIACGSSDSPENGVAAGGDGGSNGNGDGSTATADGSTTPGAACDTAAVAACGTGRKCDPTLGCVECAADGDCTAAGRDPFCIFGRCEACRTNADCGVAAPACYPGDHQCHRSCAVDSGARCQGATPLCDPATGACIGCNAPTDCPATAPICESTTKSCVTCTQNTDCPAARPKCEIPRFECVECVANVDCGAGRICNGDNHCEVGCTADQQCAGTDATKCNTSTGHCVQCLSPADCAGAPNSPICAAGRCVQCDQNADCGDGGSPFCRAAQCVQCRTGKDCPGPNSNCDKGTCK